MQNSNRKEEPMSKESYIITGETKQSFLKKDNQGKKPCCYLCKRETGAEVVAIDESNRSIIVDELHLRSFSHSKSKFSFLLCQECILLLSFLFLSKSAKPQEKLVLNNN